MTIQLTPQLFDSKVQISKLEPEDFQDLYLVASDKKIWAGHPSKDRYKRGVFKKWFDSALASKAALKIIDISTNKIIGSTRYYDYVSGQKIAIGYTFLSRNYWGGSTNTRVKKLMFDYASQDVKFIVFHIAPSNIRSQKAIEKLGAVFSHVELKELSNGTEEYLCYKYSC